MLGKWHLKQAISALEHWCFNHQSDYENNTEAQRPLHTDEQIWKFENTIAHDC